MPARRCGGELRFGKTIFDLGTHSLLYVFRHFIPTRPVELVERARDVVDHRCVCRHVALSVLAACDRWRVWHMAEAALGTPSLCGGSKNLSVAGHLPISIQRQTQASIFLIVEAT